MSGWVKFDNTMPERPKVVGVSDRAFRLWIHASCYCSRGETDGVLPARLVPTLLHSASKQALNELVKAGLVDRREDGDFEVHDYLDYNPSKEQIERLRSQSRRTSTRHRDTVTDTSPSTDPIRTDGKEDGLPTELPLALHAAAGDTYLILRALHQKRGGRAPTLDAVGRALVAFPGRDYRAVARELEGWVLDGNGQDREVKSWTQTYRTFLARSPEQSAPPSLIDTDPNDRTRAEEDAVEREVGGRAA